MAPIPSRQLLAWTLPTIAALLSYLWYKRKRIGALSDPGVLLQQTQKRDIQSDSGTGGIEAKDIASNSTKTEAVPVATTPNKSFSRSLSGVESSPIDIVPPRQLRASRSTSKVISDEELDLEIEKIKSMRSGNLFSNSKTETSTVKKQKESEEHQEQEEHQKEPVQLLQRQQKLEKEKEEEKPKVKTPSPPKKQETPSTAKKQAEAAKPAQTKSGKNKNKKNKNKMVRKDIDIVSEQISSLNLSNKKSSPVKREVREHEHHEDATNGHKSELDIQRQSNERDSANHSPADVMLASPSLSIISDNHSEGSSDSGKGGSDLATPPPSRMPDISQSAVDDIPSLYECVVPQTIVGKLIGRHGSFVNQIKDKTNALILVKRHPSNDQMKICSIEGTKNEIEKALKMIRDKFPLKRYPELTLEQVHFSPVISTVSLIPDHLYCKLVEGINNDTILSCMVAPNHLFLQQPTHPSFPSLNMLTNFMNACYSETDSPLLPMPIPENTICAAYSVDAWYRAMVLSTDEETDVSYVKLLDYGGLVYVENCKLRQIRGDFMLLPFQAAECILANIRSRNEDGSWPDEAYNLVADITKGHLIYTQVADYTEEGIPLVLCYIVAGPESVIFLNQRLVDDGYAEWVALDDEVDIQQHHQQQDALEGAVGGGIEVA